MTSRGGVSAVVAAIVVVVLVVAAVVVLYFVLAPGGAPVVTTSSIVSTPPHLLASTGQVPSAYCSSPTPPYSNSSLAIDWGNLAPGTEGIQFVCLENTGTTGVTLSVSSSLSSSTGTVTSPQAGTRLNGGGITMVELDLKLSPSIQTGPLPSFTITVGGSS